MTKKNDDKNSEIIVEESKAKISNILVSVIEISESPRESLEDHIKELTEKCHAAFTHYRDTTFNKEIIKLIGNLSGTTTAEILHQLSPSQRHIILKILNTHSLFSGKLLMALDRQILKDFLERNTIKNFDKILIELPSDDCFEILQELPERLRCHYLRDMNWDQRVYDTFTMMKNAHEDNVVRIMQTEFQSYDAEKTIDFVFRDISSKANFKGIYDIFIHTTDNTTQENKFIGSIGIFDLFKNYQSNRQKRLKEIVRDSMTISCNYSQEETAVIFHKYDLICAPILNNQNRMIGIVTVDDIMDVIQACADKEILGATGLKSTGFYTPVIKSAMERLHWHIIVLCTCFLSATVFSFFQDVIEKKIVLVTISPVVIAIGGCSGTQVAAITIRNLTNRVLRKDNIISVFMKELATSCINAFIIGTILFSITTAVYHDVSLGLLLSLTTVFNMLFSVCVGFFVPVVLDFFQYDPALGANSIVSSMADVVGMIVFLLCACYVYNISW